MDFIEELEFESKQARPVRDGSSGRSSGNRNQSRKKKKRRKKVSGVPMIVLLILLLATVVGCGFFLYNNGNRLMLPGEWSREIDVTTQAVSEAEKYIEGAAFGSEINMADYIADVKVETRLTVTKDGTITEAVSEDSYKQALAACQTGLEKAVRDLIERRIRETYIETDMSVDELVRETFGISLEEYLNVYGPGLLPDYSEFCEDYASSASYEASKDTIAITYPDGNTCSCSYAVSHGMLVIDYSTGAVVYYER